MPVLSVKRITDDDFRKRMTEARAAYLDDRFDDSVALVTDVYLHVFREDPDALAGTRLDKTNRFGQWPDYGITLVDQGTPEVSAVSDGRAQTMASAVCYFEYVLEVVLLAQDAAAATADPTKG